MKPFSLPRVLTLTGALGVLLCTAACDRLAGRAARPGGPVGEERTVRLIMSDLGFNGEVVTILKSEVAKQGFTLQWVVVNDIIQPNQLVDQGEADANSFQHEPYFEQFVADHHLRNVTRGFYTFYVPSGLYSRRHRSLREVPDGGTIGIPVDPSNNGRALCMLRDEGLIQLRDNVPVTHVSLKDVTLNPHGYRFKEVDQLMQQRTLEDVDLGFLFAVYALRAGLDPARDALARETQDVSRTPYRGVVAIHRSLVGSPKIRALQKAFASDAVKEFYRSKYGSSILFLDSLNERP